MTVRSDERVGGPARTARILRARPRGLAGRNPLSVAVSDVSSVQLALLRG